MNWFVKIIRRLSYNEKLLLLSQELQHQRKHLTLLENDMSDLKELATTLRAQIEALEPAKLKEIESALAQTQANVESNSAEDAIEKAEQDELVEAVKIILTPKAPTPSPAPSPEPAPAPDSAA